MITNIEGDYKMYFIPEMLRIDLMALHCGGLEPYPASLLKFISPYMDFAPYPDPKSNHVRHRCINKNPNGTVKSVSSEVGCCLFCADKIRDCTNGSDDPVFIQHITKCIYMLSLFTEEHYHQTVEFLEMTMTLSVLERRVLSIINLYSHPDLSNGKVSIAGEYSKSNTHKTGNIPFCFPQLEEMAFPDLFPQGNNNSSNNNIPLGIGTWKDDNKSLDLRHYTRARLNSISSKWRNNSDYVMFSLHRLVAYGLCNADKLNEIYNGRNEITSVVF